MQPAKACKDFEILRKYWPWRSKWGQKSRIVALNGVGKANLMRVRQIDHPLAKYHSTATLKVIYQVSLLASRLIAISLE